MTPFMKMIEMPYYWFDLIQFYVESASRDMTCPVSAILIRNVSRELKSCLEKAQIEGEK